MAKAKIVFAENDLYFLNTRKEFLEQAGHEVLPATTLEDARKALGRPDIDLAILDLRFENDDDEKDNTGLLLAAEDAFLSVPKIILTAFPTHEYLRLALSTGPGRLPLALDFVSKQDGPEAMLAAVTKALAIAMMLRPRHVPLTAGRKVFVVHGHDEEAKLAVARFIKNLDLEPIILSEMPGGGRAIIEQIEKHSDVSFAVVILTPDDIGSPRKQPKKRCHRARQNVIFELGYFVGRLGRDRVRSLYKKGVEVPSDYHGVLYIPMDAAGAWKMQLAKELKAAGFDIDLNKVI